MQSTQLTLVSICFFLMTFAPRSSLQQCNYLQNIEFVGNDIGGYSSYAASAVECCSRCQQLSICQAYSFSCNNICSLKYAIGSNWQNTLNSKSSFFSSEFSFSTITHKTERFSITQPCPVLDNNTSTCSRHQRPRQHQRQQQQQRQRQQRLHLPQPQPPPRQPRQARAQRLAHRPQQAQVRPRAQPARPPRAPLHRQPRQPQPLRRPLPPTTCVSFRTIRPTRPRSRVCSSPWLLPTRANAATCAATFRSAQASTSTR